MSGRAIVFSGHLTDAPDRAEARFPEESVGAARRELGAALDRWRVGAGDRAICGGARGGDILFAELCLERGARLDLVLPLPIGRFVALSVRNPGAGWEARFFSLLRQRAVATHLPPWAASDDPTAAFLANNRRMLSIADAGPWEVRVLLLWDERTATLGTGGAADFAALAAGRVAEIATVNPRRLGVEPPGGDGASDVPSLPPMSG